MPAPKHRGGGASSFIDIDQPLAARRNYDRGIQTKGLLVRAPWPFDNRMAMVSLCPLLLLRRLRRQALLG